MNSLIKMGQAQLHQLITDNFLHILHLSIYLSVRIIRINLFGYVFLCFFFFQRISKFSKRNENLIYISSMSTNYSYSPNGRVEPPRWASALCALGLFFYQSLDAIDGKQARRTNSSSPLGELFDHGCDSISTVFVALSACISAQLGFYPKWMFFQV